MFDFVFDKIFWITMFVQFTKLKYRTRIFYNIHIIYIKLASVNMELELNKLKRFILMKHSHSHTWKCVNDRSYTDIPLSIHILISKSGESFEHHGVLSK